MSLQVIEPDVREIGDLEVRRLLPASSRKMVGPFIFWDHFGPVVLPAGKGLDVRPHPHIGLATLTYLFEGEILHRDSLGMVQPIRPGAVNWMTAGRGIVHSERTDTARRQHPNPLHGLQICWLALPLEKEDTEPEFNHYPSGSLPRVTRGSVEFTLIAGRALGAESPVRVFSPLFYMEGRLDRGAGFEMFREYPERAVYVVDGTISIDGVAVGSRCMGVFDKDAAPRVTATDDARVAVFGGESVGPRRIWWNFVASSRARIRAAAERWADGGFERVPGDDEFIPLPDDLPWKD